MDIRCAERFAIGLQQEQGVAAGADHRLLRCHQPWAVCSQESGLRTNASMGNRYQMES